MDIKIAMIHSYFISSIIKRNTGTYTMKFPTMMVNRVYYRMIEASEYMKSSESEVSSDFASAD